MAELDELAEYSEDEMGGDGVGWAAGGAGAPLGGASDKPTAGAHVGIHHSGFRDFMLIPELLRAIVEAGFEHPSQVQHECLPNAILGMDVLCQAKSGMGKTAVFVLATLQQLVPKEGEVSVVVLVHTKEMAFQIGREYERFKKFMDPPVKSLVLYGGLPVQQHVTMIKEQQPHIIIGTPGRVMDLAVQRGALDLSHVKFFIVDECDQVLDKIDMRRQVQQVFKLTPHQKQVMMFSATMPAAIKTVCRKFMKDPMEIFVDSDSKLTLHGLLQYFVRLTPEEKNRKLTDLLDALEFNQVIIFVSKVARAKELDALLRECNFPSVCVHSAMDVKERIKRYKEFKEYTSRILVATDLYGRGVDVERVNIVINYDFPQTDPRLGPPADQYLHRVGRAGRFGTKGLAISFISSDEDAAVLSTVQQRFEVEIEELPSVIDPKKYMQ